MHWYWKRKTATSCDQSSRRVRGGTRKRAVRRGSLTIEAYVGETGEHSISVVEDEDRSLGINHAEAYGLCHNCCASGI